MKTIATYFNDKAPITILRTGDLYTHDRQAFLVVSAIKKPDIYDRWTGETGEGICLSLFNLDYSRLEYREQSIHTEYHFFKLVARSIR